ncbi:hypothetical protein HK097_003369 [Rhizophlyctis rosea]|uniref:Uncharacterized protein n=1 Tax=Rhizophlyctis rosea TaxID=64517 RepID=A0AAD5S9W2_9FUNG|nr:hypothetical protein HK097_003369 [Rhizophlyctis rosea]
MMASNQMTAIKGASSVQLSNLLQAATEALAPAQAAPVHSSKTSNNPTTPIQKFSNIAPTVTTGGKYIVDKGTTNPYLPTCTPIGLIRTTRQAMMNAKTSFRTSRTPRGDMWGREEIRGLKKRDRRDLRVDHLVSEGGGGGCGVGGRGKSGLAVSGEETSGVEV